MAVLFINIMSSAKSKLPLKNTCTKYTALIAERTLKELLKNVIA